MIADTTPTPQIEHDSRLFTTHITHALSRALARDYLSHLPSHRRTCARVHLAYDSHTIRLPTSNQNFGGLKLKMWWDV